MECWADGRSFSDNAILETVLKRSRSGMLAGNSFRGSIGFNEVFPVLTGQENNFGMPPEYNDKLRLSFVENAEHFFQWLL